MAFDKLTQRQLADAVEGGLIEEDVESSIGIDNRERELNLMSMTAAGSHSNSYCEWTIDRVRDADPTIALEDGADIVGDNSGYGVRVGNRTQTMGSRLMVSYEAEASDTIGRASELGYQISMESEFLERSMQQQLYGNTASVASGDGVAGISAGLEALITAEDLVRGTTTTAASWTTTKLGTADSPVQQVNTAGTITGGGLDNFGATTAGIQDAWVYSGTVTTGAITETAVRNVIQAIWQRVGRRQNLKGLNRGGLNRKFSEYSFGSTSRIATMVNNENDGARDPREGQGATNIFITDFGVLEFVPEVEMPIGDATESSDTLFVIDPTKIKRSNMWNWRAERQGKTGLSEKWQISKAYSLKFLSPGTCGMVQGIDATADMTA